MESPILKNDKYHGEFSVILYLMDSSFDLKVDEPQKYLQAQAVTTLR